MLTEATRERILAVAVKQRRWDAAKTRLAPKQELDRAGCAFYFAAPEDRTVSWPEYFATLPDGRVAGVDLRGDAAAATLLAVCGKDAPADWWATVLARFSDGVGGVVLSENGLASGIRRVRERGATFMPPALSRSAAGTELDFFAYDAESKVPYRVRAVLSADGKLQVDAKPL